MKYKYTPNTTVIYSLNQQILTIKEYSHISDEPAYLMSNDMTVLEKNLIQLKEIKTFQELIDRRMISGYRICDGKVSKCATGRFKPSPVIYETGLTKEDTESALAHLQLSQLMPYYGGKVPMTESAYVITTINENDRTYPIVILDSDGTHPTVLRFHKKSQAQEFLLNNFKLICKYLMLNHDDDFINNIISNYNFSLYSE